MSGLVMTALAGGFFCVVGVGLGFAADVLDSEEAFTVGTWLSTGGAVVYVLSAISALFQYAMGVI